MTSSTNLRVSISADLANIKAGLVALRKDLAGVKSAAERSMPDGNAFVGGLRRARAELVGFAAAYLSLAGAKVLSGIADEATMLRGRLKEAKGDYEDILQLAQETRTGLAQTVDLYARLERSTRTQGVNQQRLLGITQSINQAVKLSYTSAASADAALNQLGQGLSSGTLRGEELNSVMEQTPRLAQAIADGLGKPIGALRALAKEGKLTTEVVIKALESQAQALEKEYARVPVTIGDAFTQLRNKLVDYIGDTDAATGASRKFAQSVQDFASELPKYLDPLLTAITLLLRNLDLLAVFMVTRMAAAAIPAIINGFVAMRAAMLAAAAGATTLRAALTLLGGPIGLIIAGLTTAIYFLATRTSEATKAAEKHQEAMDKVRISAIANKDEALKLATAYRTQSLAALNAAKANLVLKKSQFDAEKENASNFAAGGRSVDKFQSRASTASNDVSNAQRTYDQAKKQLNDINDEVIKLYTDIESAKNSAASSASSIAVSTGKTKEAIKGIVDQTELSMDAIARQQKAIDRLYEEGQLSITDYYNKKRELELASIDGQIAQAEAEVKTAKSSDQQSKALTEIIKLQRERAEVGPAVARDQAAAEAGLAKELENVRLRMLEMNGQTAEASRAKLESEFKDLLQRLTTEGRAAEAAVISGFIDASVVKAQVEEFETKAQAILAELRSAESSLSSQASGGLIGSLEAETQIDEKRTQALEKLRLLRESVLAYYEATKDPSVLTFLQDLNGNIGQVAASQQQLRQQVADAATNSVANLFTDLATGAKSAKQALIDFVRSFVTSMATIAARALATYLVLQLLDAIYPGLGKAVAAGYGATGGVNHTGGLAGMGGTIRSGINPMLFGAAPRYHTGGVAGLGANEVPAILERGEEVLTKRDSRHVNNGGRNAGRGGNQRFIFVDDQRNINNYLNTPDGEEAFVRFIGQNSGRIREALS